METFSLGWNFVYPVFFQSDGKILLILCLLKGQVLWLFVKSGVIRSRLNFWSANFPSSAWCVKLLRTSKQICVSRAQLLVLCRYVVILGCLLNSKKRSFPGPVTVLMLFDHINDCFMLVTITFYLNLCIGCIEVSSLFCDLVLSKALGGGKYGNFLIKVI